MNSEVRVATAFECVFARLSGQVTVTERSILLSEITAMCRLSGYTRVVLDHRDSVINCSAADSFELGQDLAKAWPKTIASVDVVVTGSERPQGLNSNKLFALLCAANRGLSVSVHADLDSALQNFQDPHQDRPPANVQHPPRLSLPAIGVEIDVAPVPQV